MNTTAPATPPGRGLATGPTARQVAFGLGSWLAMSIALHLAAKYRVGSRVRACFKRCLDCLPSTRSSTTFLAPSFAMTSLSSRPSCSAPSEPVLPHPGVPFPGPLAPHPSYEGSRAQGFMGTFEEVVLEPVPAAPKVQEAAPSTAPEHSKASSACLPDCLKDRSAPDSTHEETGWEKVSPLLILPPLSDWSCGSRCTTRRSPAATGWRRWSWSPSGRARSSSNSLLLTGQ